MSHNKFTSQPDPRIAQTFEKLVKRVITWNMNGYVCCLGNYTLHYYCYSNMPIMVVGVTSQPDRLLQRISGCFIHEVAMTTPNQEQRVQIMKGLCKGMSLAKGELVSYPLIFFVPLRSWL